jgi:hypothetical protein
LDAIGADKTEAEATRLKVKIIRATIFILCPKGAAYIVSAFGPKQTCASALHMSAFGGKADMTVCGSPLSRSLLGAKRT